VSEERSFRIGAAVSAACGLVLVLWLVLEPGGERLTQAVSDVAQSVIPLLAAAACFHAARRSFVNSFGIVPEWKPGLRNRAIVSPWWPIMIGVRSGVRLAA